MDEVATWYSVGAARGVEGTGFFENLHGPLYNGLLSRWAQVAGTSEWALRVPSAVLGVALVAAIAWLAGRWLSRAAVVPAAWLAAASPFLIWYAQEARNYTMLMLASACAAALALRCAERPGPRRLAAYLAAAWAGLMSNLSFFLVLPFHQRVLVRGWRGRRTLLIAASALGVLVLLLLPWLVHVGRTLAWYRLLPTTPSDGRAEVLRGAPSFHWAALPYTWLSFSVGYTLGPSLRELHASPTMGTAMRHAAVLLPAAIAFAVLTVAGLVALRRQGRAGDAALWFLVPAAALTVLAACNVKAFNPRYLAACAPGYVALLAGGWTTLERRARAAVTVVVVAACGLSLWNHYFVPAYGKEDFRAAGARLAAGGDAHDVVIAAGASDPLFYYYAGPMRVEPYWLGWASDPARMRQRFVERAAGRPVVWVVVSRPEDLDPRDRFAIWLDRTFPGCQEPPLPGIRMWRVPAPASGWSAVPRSAEHRAE